MLILMVRFNVIIQYYIKVIANVVFDRVNLNINYKPSCNLLRKRVCCLR